MIFSSMAYYFSIIGCFVAEMLSNKLHEKTQGDCYCYRDIKTLFYRLRSFGFGQNQVFSMACLVQLPVVRRMKWFSWEVILDNHSLGYSFYIFFEILFLLLFFFFSSVPFFIRQRLMALSSQRTILKRHADLLMPTEHLHNFSDPKTINISELNTKNTDFKALKLWNVRSG